MTNKLIAQREYHTINPISEMPHEGKWVIRDENGAWIDADKYSNDLRSRYGNIEFIDG